MGSEMCIRDRFHVRYSEGGLNRHYKHTLSPVCCLEKAGHLRAEPRNRFHFPLCHRTTGQQLSIMNSYPGTCTHAKPSSAVYHINPSLAVHRPITPCVPTGDHGLIRPAVEICHPCSLSRRPEYACPLPLPRHSASCANLNGAVNVVEALLNVRFLRFISLSAMSHTYSPIASDLQLAPSSL